MAVLEQESFDGLANGATISTANTSFDTVTGTGLDATTNAIHGTGAMDISTTTADDTCRWTTTVNGRTLLHARVYARVLSVPANDTWFCGCGNAAGSVAVVVVLRDTGQIQILQSNETGNVQSSAQVFGANDELRVEWELDLTNGTQTAELFYGANIEGTTADETLSTSASMADMADWRVGAILDRATPIVVDEPAIGDAPIGPVGSGGGAITGSGEMTPAAGAVGGSGSVAVTGSGGVSAAPATLSGGGAVTVTGAGALAAAAASVEGSGTVGDADITGSGALTVRAASIGGSGSVAVAASGQVVPPAGAVSGAGAVIISGAGQLNAAAATVSGSEVPVVTPEERTSQALSEVRTSVAVESRVSTVHAESRVSVAR